MDDALIGPQKAQVGGKNPLYYKKESEGTMGRIFTAGRLSIMGGREGKIGNAGGGKRLRMSIPGSSRVGRKGEIGSRK